MEEEKKKEKDFYKEAIVQKINNVERLEVLMYLYFFISEKLKVG